MAVCSSTGRSEKRAIIRILGSLKAQGVSESDKIQSRKQESVTLFGLGGVFVWWMQQGQVGVGLFVYY